MGKILGPLIVIILTCICNNVYAQKDRSSLFDLLFDDGEEPETEEVIQVSFQLNKVYFEDLYEIRQNDNILYMSVEDFFDIFSIMNERENDLVRGWFISPEKTFYMDFKGKVFRVEGQEVYSGPEDIMYINGKWYISTGLLTKIFSVDFTFNTYNQSLKAESGETFPVELLLARQKYREKIKNINTDDVGPDYEQVHIPYRWIDWPSAEFDIGTEMQSGAASRYSVIQMGGDLLKNSFHFYAAESGKKGLYSSRMTLGRNMDAGEERNFLNPQRYSFGDITYRSRPFLGVSLSGRGGSISNGNKNRIGINDTRVLRGILLPDWEAELYSNGQLVRFQIYPDDNGEYVFENIPLRAGYNELEVRLYSPYGEIKKRIETVYVGKESVEQGRLYYDIGIIDDDTTLFGVSETGDNGRFTGYGSFDYGLGNNISLSFDTVLPDAGKEMSFFSGINGSLYGIYGGISISRKGNDLPRYRINLEKKNRNNQNFYLEITKIVKPVDHSAGLHSKTADYNIYGNFNARTDIFRMPLVFNTGIKWLEKADKTSIASINTTVSSRYRSTSWSNTVKNTFSSENAMKREYDLDGTFRLSRSLKGFQVRSEIEYGYDDEFDISSVSFSLYKNVVNDRHINLIYRHDLNTDRGVLNIRFSRFIRHFLLSGYAGTTLGKDWNAGLKVAFSVFRDERSGELRMARPGITRSGVVDMNVFEDIDGNRLYDIHDIPVVNVSPNNRMASGIVRTDTSGRAVLTKLPVSKRIDIEIDRSSIDDMSLIPLFTGKNVHLRPGKVFYLDYPLAVSAEIDGYITHGEGEDTMISGLLIEAVDSEGNIIGSTRSEFDGYFFLDGLPASPLYLRVNTESLKKYNLVYKDDVMIDLTRDAPFKFDVMLEVHHQ